MSPTVQPGSGVAIVAPAGPVSEASYQAGLAILAKRYRLVRVHDPAEYAPPRPLSYLAADDARRARELGQAIADPAVSAIFCARGGYGCARIIERLDRATFARRGLPLVGFSDITVIHAWAAQLGVPTIHGPVVTQLPRLPSAQLDALFALLEVGEPAPLTGLCTVRGGVARGPLWGGNLNIISHLLGTPHWPPLDGRILLLEDVGEAPYRIDKMCTQLLHSGALNRVAGVVLGQFVDCHARSNAASGPSAHEVLEERLADLRVPIVAHAPVGHGSENVALPLGCMAELDATAGTLRFIADPPAITVAAAGTPPLSRDRKH